MENVIDGVLNNIYTDVVPWVESDSWSNYRNSIINSLTDYSSLSRNEKHSHIWKTIRKKILDENREEIINDLNQDFLEEIEELKKENKELYDQLC